MIAKAASWLERYRRQLKRRSDGWRLGGVHGRGGCKSWAGTPRSLACSGAGAKLTSASAQILPEIQGFILRFAQGGHGLAIQLWDREDIRAANGSHPIATDDW